MLRLTSEAAEVVASTSKASVELPKNDNVAVADALKFVSVMLKTHSEPQLLKVM